MKDFKENDESFIQKKYLTSFVVYLFIKRNQRPI